MRILGNIDHTQFKITVFQMDGRLSLKLEDGMHEQTYRFRDGEGMETLKDVERFVDGSFLRSVSAIFRAMRQARMESVGRSAPASDEFDDII